MAEINFSIDWLSSESSSPIFRDTSGQLAIHLDSICLTRNEDVWSSTVRDSVLVSAYPLALWLASSWWRLNFEPLPHFNVRPLLDWRMAHELGAANHGYVWPRIIFAADGQSVNVWAEQVQTVGQSVQYLYGLDVSRAVPLADFQRRIGGFIERVITRLRALGHHSTDLAELWTLIREDRGCPESARYRVLEAQMGYDPDECPEQVIAEALTLQKETGATAMSELAPVFGRRSEGRSGFTEISDLASQSGIQGRPQISAEDLEPSPRSLKPWERGVDSARQLRKKIGNSEEPIKNAEIYELLGITERQVEDWDSSDRSKVAIAAPMSGNGLKYVPRKKHPIAKRFEFARLIGEILDRPKADDGWLVSTDVATAKQKRQRSFAAEFLCPINSLVGYLAGEYSESSFEDAAEHFNVSEKTIESLLANNGYLDNSSSEPKVPYRSAC
ncbi:MAG: ImmA/IrrE family metallo-endopeptidase [Pseudomonas sp.]